MRVSRRWGWALLGVVGWLAVLEGAFRWPFLQRELAPYLSESQWYSPYVAAKVDVLAAQPQTPVWFIGSSAVHHGMNPALLPAVSSLNLGLVGLMKIEHLRAYTEAVFWPIAQPKVLVIGVIPYRFAWTFPEPYRSQERDFIIRTRQWDYQLGAWLSARSALYRESRALAGFFTQTLPSQSAAGVQPNGYEPRTVRIDEQPVFPYVVPEVTENDYLETSLSLLAAWQADLAAQGVAVWLVNLPIHHTLLEHYPGGVAQFRAYQARLAAFSAAQALPFYDLHAGLEAQFGQPIPEQYFAEYTHLNAEGVGVAAPLLNTFMQAAAQ